MYCLVMILVVSIPTSSNIQPTYYNVHSRFDLPSLFTVLSRGKSPDSMFSIHRHLIGCIAMFPVGMSFVILPLQARYTGTCTGTSRNGRRFLLNNLEYERTGGTRRDLIDHIITASFFIPSVAEAMYTDPTTRILLPSEGEVESAIPTTFDDNPFEGLDKTSFSRLDQAPDSVFYRDPRFTEHADDNAVQTMTRFIANDVLKQNDSVLDLCSSWTSHIDKDTVQKLSLQRVAGLGMNEEELKANTALNDYNVVDLNAKPNVQLPYGDSSFNVVLCQLSIDYLIHPLNVMKEVGRVLKPGGKFVVLFSNRLFITKAVGLWTGKDDLDHVYTVGR